MSGEMVRILVVLATIAVHSNALESGLRMEVWPKVVNELVTDKLSVKCVPNDKSVLVIELGKTGQRPLAVLRQNHLTHGADMKDNMKAEGLIDEVNITDSHLTITIKKPGASDGGQYECKSFFIDVEGTLKEGKAYANVTVDNNNDKVVHTHLLKQLAELKTQFVDQKNEIDSLGKQLEDQPKETDSLKTQLRDQQKEIATLKKQLGDQPKETDSLTKQIGNQQKETNSLKTQLEDQQKESDSLKKQLGDQQIETGSLKKQIGDQQKETDSLKTQLGDKQKEIDSLKQQHVTHEAQYTLLDNKVAQHVTKESFRSAFLAGGSGSYTTRQIVKYSTVKLNIGGHYNSGTGVYTAPVDGLYVFHLLGTTYASDDYVHIVMRVNGVAVSRIRAHDKDDWVSYSMSAIANLKTGDKVDCFVDSVTGGSVGIDGLPYSAFSGYLIKTM